MVVRWWCSEGAVVVKAVVVKAVLAKAVLVVKAVLVKAVLSQAMFGGCINMDDIRRWNAFQVERCP